MRRRPQRGKISPRLLTRHTFPPNRSSFRWGRNDTMGKSHPLLIGDGMRSASSALRIVLSTTLFRKMFTALRCDLFWLNSIKCVTLSHYLCRTLIVDRELARFIYVREVKRFDPNKFSIYAWYIKIVIAGSLAPIRLAWVPFLRVPKNGFIYVEADTKKLYAGL